MPEVGHSRPRRPAPRSLNVRYASNCDQIADMPKAMLSAMYGRRLRCKGKIWHFSEAFGCSHVFGL
jgi:hypothetical protein